MNRDISSHNNEPNHLPGSLSETPALPFPVPLLDTQWVVLTGQPSSGKSTLLEALAKIGFTTSKETAREYVYEQMERGLTIQEIRSDMAHLQSSILGRSITRALEADPSQLVIFDRGIPDSIAYHRHHGLNPEYSRKASEQVRYKKVFMLDAVGFKQDGIRSESAEIAQRMEDELIKAYSELGYEIIRVPAVSVEERVNIIVRALAE